MRTKLLRFVAAVVLALALAPTLQAATYYTTNILNDAPTLYWSFDETDGNALQLAPLGSPAPLTTENDLVPVSGADRVTHADIGGLPKLGRTASLDGTNFFRADALRAGRSSLNPPWALEFWMQVTGPNTGNRADYLINFGNAGADNAPAFIYDFEPDTLEVFGGSAGRTANSPAIADTNWHHVVWVYYGDGVSGVANRCDLWVDGVNFGNVRDTYARAIKVNERLLVGAAVADGGGGFEGRLDELAIYDLSSQGDEAGVSAKVTQLVGDHYLEGTAETGNAYMDAVLADSPFLYWNFDEASGNALQKAPITLPIPNNDQNQLLPQAGDARVSHAGIGSGFQLGNALDLTGLNHFQAADLDAGIESVGAPWAVEFWMQVGGDNSGNRADYLINFGTSPGGDNSPAFIYDYKPDQLEIYALAPRTDNGPVISDGGWHHVVWVFYGDGTNGVGNRVEAFVDGVNLGRDVRATFTRALKISDGLLVGAAAPGGIDGFEGRLDELAIYRLAGLADEAAVRTRVTLMASNHFLAAFGPPGNAAITLTQQPADATAHRGGTATFTVAATVSGVPPESLTYQWLRNGSPIPGATAVSYTTPVLSLRDLGTSTYAVRVSTVGGVFVLSRDAVLTVPVPPYEATYYTDQMLQDSPFLYWNFDENSGNAIQRAPLGSLAPVTTENDLVPVASATRVDSTGKLGRAASLNGTNYYQAATLQAGKASVAAPWALEFWMQVQGDNSGNRADYLINFGNGGADNAPSFIYDYEPDTLEALGNGRTANSPAIADNNWHHVVWVYYGDGVSGVANRCDLWVDGANFGNVRDTYSRAITLNQRLLVGAATAAADGGFEGQFDELAIYDLGALSDEAAVTAKAQSLASHYASAFSADPQPYSEVILAQQPVLYWNFDEADGNARQLAPVARPPLNNSQNDLVPAPGAGRVEHSLAGSGLFLGNAANLSGQNFFQALDLDTAKSTLTAPWAVEFWMQVQGDNSGNRADYLMNFGASPDNFPAFIYDFNPDQLEVYGAAGGRSGNGPIIADGNWHHMMWVFYGDGASGVADRLEAWVDGVNLGNARNDYSRAIKVNERLLVGAATAVPDDAFEGRMDEIAIYDLSSLTMEAAVAAHVQDLVARHRGAATNPPPALKIARSANQIIISWSRAGFVLQENSDVANLAGWTDVTGGGTSPVTITLPAGGNKFYRLRSQ